MEDRPGVERVERVEGHVVRGRRTVVTALPLKRAAREELSRLLDARVLDVREHCERPDLVLTPACSPQLIGALKRKYHGARVVVVELDDWDLDVELGGPVKRVLRAGADGYVLADSLEELAGKLAPAGDTAGSAERSTLGELPDGATVDDLIAAFLRGSVDAETHARSSRPDPPDRGR